MESKKRAELGLLKKKCVDGRKGVGDAEVTVITDHKTMAFLSERESAGTNTRLGCRNFLGILR